MSDQLPLFGEAGHPSRPRQRERVRDPLFDAVVQCCKINPNSLTHSGRGMLNRSLKELRCVNAKPEDVLHRSRAYVERYRHTPTPGALARHWASLEVRPQGIRRIEPQIPENAVQTLTREQLSARIKAWREYRSGR